MTDVIRRYNYTLHVEKKPPEMAKKNLGLASNYLSIRKSKTPPQYRDMTSYIQFTEYARNIS